MLTKTDKKEVREIVVEAMTDVMMPVLDKIMKTQDEQGRDINDIKEDVSILKEDVSMLKEDVSIIKEDVRDLQLAANRIETLQHHELDRTDDHEIRIIKLEKTRAK